MCGHISFLFIMFLLCVTALIAKFQNFCHFFFISIAFRVICHIEGDHQIFAEGINTNFII